MSLGSWFKGVVGDKRAVEKKMVAKAEQRQEVAQGYLNVQKQAAGGMLTASRRTVALMTITAEIQTFAEERVWPAVEKAGFRLIAKADVDAAATSQICLLDGTPRADALMHDKYDKILRVKKSLGKTRDLFCIIGHRQDFKKYPRGTYPGLIYFCIKEDDLEHREADLPVDGLPTVEGPLLFNFADMPQVLVAKINSMK